MKKTTNLLLMSSLSIACCYAQSQTYGIEPTVEQIVKIEGLKGRVIGTSSEGAFFAYLDDPEEWTYSFQFYNEINSTITPVFESFVSQGRSCDFFAYDNKLFFAISYFDTPEDSGYYKIYLHYKGENYYLDSFSNAEKPIRMSFSAENRMLLLTTLYDPWVHEHDPIKDDYIFIYHLDNIEARIRKDSIHCKRCNNATLIGNKLFFTIPNYDNLGDFLQDVYVAPWGNISDTTRIASGTHWWLFSVSSDGKYILTRRSDLSDGVAVIIDVETKKYQILIGRDYQRSSSFYSEVKQKFAFRFGDEIIYVKKPIIFPFDALQRDNPLVPFQRSREIRRMFDR